MKIAGVQCIELNTSAANIIFRSVNEITIIVSLMFKYIRLRKQNKNYTENLDNLANIVSHYYYLNSI
jgi:hypothetical protein